ncbi:unnamed protein product [Vicia faba]|uniref:Uncharacterized protein n=1 Tax=Vicia faba TaxID=3906 RepID=A0AAV0ZS85_VICFA|nr:unnamed protein product [Vicia faba]
MHIFLGSSLGSSLFCICIFSAYCFDLYISVSRFYLFLFVYQIVPITLFFMLPTLCLFLNLQYQAFRTHKLYSIKDSDRYIIFGILLISNRNSFYLSYCPNGSWNKYIIGSQRQKRFGVHDCPLMMFDI